MITEIVSAYNERKGSLAEHWRQNGLPKDYTAIVKALFQVVVNPYADDHLIGENWGTPFDLEKITVLGGGQYEGVLLFLIPADKGILTIDDWLVTFVDYGTSSATDTFADVVSSHRLYDEDERDTEGAISDFLKLALHLVQRMKFIKNDN